MNPLALLGPYRYLVLAAVAAIVVAGAYVSGRIDGRAVEASRWQARELEHQQRAAADREQLQAALDARSAELAARQQEAANAVVQIRTEYLPAKTIVRREVAERVVFRDCVIGSELRDTLNAALRGSPVAGPPERGAADGVSF